MSSLPLEKILLRLPAFDLVRCKAVCKAWRSLISSADFIDAHLQRSKSDPSSHHILVRKQCLFDTSRPVADPFFSYLICLSSEDLLIVGSVNGLICIAGKGDIPYTTPRPDDVWILNPVTGLSKKLPYSSRVSFGSDENFKFAFWCDDSVYKLAKISSVPDGAAMLELWVSTSPDTWTVISTFELDFRSHPRPFHACDVLIEGLAAYWIVVDCGVEDGDEASDNEVIVVYHNDDEDSDDEVIVVSLDLKSLALTKLAPLSNRQLHMPKGYLRKARNGVPNSVLFGGSLNNEFVLIAYNLSADTEYYDVLTAVKDDTGAPSWIKKFTICFDSFLFDKCLGIVNDKLVLTSWHDMVVASCDPLTGMLEVLERDFKFATFEDFACGFVGSLVSIDGFGFETNDLLCKNMCINWPYSLYPSRKEGWRKNRKKRTRWQ